MYVYVSVGMSVCVCGGGGVGVGGVMLVMVKGNYLKGYVIILVLC